MNSVSVDFSYFLFLPCDILLQRKWSNWSHTHTQSHSKLSEKLQQATATLVLLLTTETQTHKLLLATPLCVCVLGLMVVFNISPRKIILFGWGTIPVYCLSAVLLLVIAKFQKPYCAICNNLIRYI